MKKLFALSLILILALSLVGCGNRTPDANTPPQSSSAATADTQGDEIFNGTPVNETKTSDGYDITVLSIAKSEGSANFKPQDGNVYVFIKIAVKNNTGQDAVISSLLHFTTLIGGEKVESSLTGNGAGPALMELGGAMINGDVAADGTLEGYYYEEVPKTAKKLELVFDSSLMGSQNKAVFTLNIPK